MRARSRISFDVLFPVLYATACSVLGLGLQLRLFPIGDIDLETDFYGDLVIAARHVVEGAFTVDDFPYKGPFYSLALLIARSLAGDWYRGAILLSATAGGVFLVLAYRLVRRLYDRRVAVLSMTASSLVVEFFVQCHRASTDVLFLSLCMGSMTLSLTAGGSTRRQALAGGLAALAFLTRYNGIFLVGGAALVVAIVNPDCLRRPVRFKSFAVYSVSFLVLCAPWFLVNWMETGRILATRNVSNVVATFFGGPRWADDPASRIQSLSDLLTAHPGYLVQRFALNLFEHTRNDLDLLLGWPMALLPIVGVLGFAIRRPTRSQIAFFVFGLTYWFCMGIVFYSTRFFLPLDLPYLVLGLSLLDVETVEATAWGRNVRRWFERGNRRRLGMAGLTAGVLLAAAVQVWRIVAVERQIYARRPLYILKAAQALSEREHRSRARILARKGHIAYYAGFDFSPYSTDVRSLEELVQHARNLGARYISYSAVEYSLLPRMLFMAVTDTVPLLEEVYREPRIRIFRLADNPPALSDFERYQLLLANLRAARSQRRPEAVYLACTDLGSFHLQRRDFTKATAFFKDALELAERADSGPVMARAAAVARHDLARAETGAGRSEAAIDLLQSNLRYFERFGSRRDVARTHAALGRALEIAGRDEEARRERRMAGELEPASADSTGTEDLDVELDTQ